MNRVAALAHALSNHGETAAPHLHLPHSERQRLGADDELIEHRENGIQSFTPSGLKKVQFTVLLNNLPPAPP